MSSIKSVSFISTDVSECIWYAIGSKMCDDAPFDVLPFNSYVDEDDDDDFEIVPLADAYDFEMLTSDKVKVSRR